MRTGIVSDPMSQHEFDRLHENAKHERISMTRVMIVICVLWSVIHPRSFAYFVGSVCHAIVKVGTEFKP